MERTIHISILPKYITCQHLFDIFRRFGKIEDIRIKHHIFGFVQYKHAKDADYAVKKSENLKVFGRRIKVSKAKVNRTEIYKKVHTEHRLIVKNLSRTATWRDLKYYMMKAGGVVTFADVVSLHEGIVEFQTRDDMEKTISKLNQTIFKGLMIRLVRDTGSKRHLKINEK